MKIDSKDSQTRITDCLISNDDDDFELGMLEVDNHCVLSDNLGLLLLYLAYLFDSIMQVCTNILETSGDQPDDERIKPLQFFDENSHNV